MRLERIGGAGRRLGALVGAILVLAMLPAPPARPDPAKEAMRESTCVSCHKRLRYLVTNRKLWDYYQQWEKSLHAREGVDCSDCHGGQPRLRDKESSHPANLSESAEGSPVNFAHIPETCGKCHQPYYDAYRESAHFQHLVEAATEEQGPSCVTCHGSVQVEVLRVNTVAQSCALCHNAETGNLPENPERASAILNKLLSIKRYYRFITARDKEATPEYFEALSRLMNELAVAWHTFDLDDVEERTDVVLALLKARRNELRTSERETPR